MSLKIAYIPNVVFPFLLEVEGEDKERRNEAEAAVTF